MNEFTDVIALEKNTNVKYYFGAFDFLFDTEDASFGQILKRNDDGYYLKTNEKNEDYIKVIFNCLKSFKIEEFDKDVDVNVEKEYKKIVQANIVFFEDFVAFYDSDEHAIKEFIKYAETQNVLIESEKVSENQFQNVKDILSNIESVKVKKIKDKYIKEIEIKGKSENFDSYQSIIDFENYETANITGYIEEENCMRKIKLDKSGKICFYKNDKEFTLQNIRHGYRILTSGENND